MNESFQSPTKKSGPPQTPKAEAERAQPSVSSRRDWRVARNGEAIITTDTKGRVALLNRTAEMLTGWRSEEAAKQPLSDVFRLVTRSGARVGKEFWTRIVQTGQGIPEEGRERVLVARDGSRVSVSHSAAAIRDDHGNVTGVVHAFRDISAQLRLEQELLQSQKLESLGILAGGIAHDFNNTLSGILLKTQLATKALEKGTDPGKYLDSIRKAVRTATNLTRQLLTFAKGGAPVKQLVRPAPLLRECAEFALQGSSLRQVVQIPDDLQMVNVDRGQISQVMHNLIINATQAMPDGGSIFIQAENVESRPGNPIGHLSPGRYVKVSVRDQGTGISPEDLGSIFDPYFSTKTKGHGLGLTMSHSILGKHGGSISVESQLHRGTCFSFFLPAVDCQETVQSSPERRPSPGSARILIMDDDTDISQSLGQLLEDLGYRVALASNGSQALSLYQEARDEGRPFGAVIMDLTIAGGMGGMQAVKALLEMDPDALAIVSSGYSEAPVMADYKEYGFRAVLTKPFGLEQVSQILKELLGGERAEARLDTRLRKVG
ncbi:MAG: ATP-binding protein [Acidobacteriota bacterium]